MLKVTTGNNMKRTTVFVDENTTLKECLEANEVDYTRGTVHLDSAPLGPGDLNKTFASLGYDGTPDHDKCYLLNVVKADNA